MRVPRIHRYSLHELTLALEATWMLFKADVLASFGYAALRRQMSVGVGSNGDRDKQQAITAVATAVSRASRYYPRSPACLQRSVALASMLRRRGIAADLQIGVQSLPFKSHAWVEVDGTVINDVPEVREVYSQLHEFKGRQPTK